MKKTKILLVAAFAAVLASCGGGKSGGKPNFGDNEYAVRTVQGQDAALQTTYPATIKGVQDVEIRPKVSGFITKLCVKEGQQVKAGQLLFVIDNVTYAAAVRQAKASVNAAKAQLNTARLTYKTLRSSSRTMLSVRTSCSHQRTPWKVLPHSWHRLRPLTFQPSRTLTSAS